MNGDSGNRTPDEKGPTGDYRDDYEQYRPDRQASVTSNPSTDLPEYTIEKLAENFPNRVDYMVLSGPYTPVYLARAEIERLTREIAHRDELERFAAPLSCPTHGLVPNLALFDNKCPACERDRLNRQLIDRSTDGNHYRNDLRVAREAYAAATAARDRLRATLNELQDEAQAVMHGEHGSDWADHFAPLFNLIQRAKALVSGEPSAHETSGDGSYLSCLRVAADEARSLLVHVSETGVCDNWTEPGHASLSQVCLDAAAKLYAAIEGSPEKADGRRISHFPDNETLKRQILNDPDDEPSAGNVP